MSEGMGTGFQGENLRTPVQYFMHGWLAPVCRDVAVRAVSQLPRRDIGRFAPAAAERDRA